MSNRLSFTATRALIDKWTSSGILPGAAIQVQQHGEMLFEYYSGFASLEPQIPAGSQHIWAVASISKPVATVALMKLVKAGYLHLDQPVVEITPDFAPNREETLVRHLVTHTSGIPEEWHDQKLIDEICIAATIARSELLFNPGTQCSYCTATFAFLALFVQKFTGQDWTTYTSEHLFKPLDMHDTSYRMPESKYDRLAVVYDENSSAKNFFNSEMFRQGGWPGASLFSNLHDLAIFGQAFLDKDRRLLRPESYLQMITLQTPGLRNLQGKLDTWGLGWYLNMNKTEEVGSLLSERAFNHTGATGTNLIIDPEKELVIVFLANRIGLPNSFEMHAELNDTVLLELQSNS